jgi:ABC-type branched-subunit amino acid transport system ATPase component
MREAYGNVNLVPGFGREFCRNILAIRRRAASYIHGDIENSPGQNGDQLRLGRRRKLEMQTAQRACPLGARLIVLDEAAGNANGV